MQRCVALRHISLGWCRKLGDVAIGVNGVSGYCTLTCPPPYFDLRAMGYHWVRFGIHQREPQMLRVTV